MYEQDDADPCPYSASRRSVGAGRRPQRLNWPGLASSNVANAGFPNQLPFMCFNTGNTFHQTFGPISFFLNETQQGPTSFQEGPPTSKPVVILPLHRGAAAGHLVYYVITDASDLTVAQDLGVNYTPKLANAAGTSAVQRSSSSDPTSI